MPVHSPRPATHDEPDLPTLLMLTARRMRRAHLDALEPYGVTPQLARALGTIERLSAEGEVRPSTVAARMEMSPRSATEVVDALEARGLVAREPSPADRRATALTVTDAGRVLRQKMGAARNEETESLTRNLTADERAQLTLLLRKLLDA